MPFNPTAQEQEMLELINRMRINPADELDYLINSSDPDVEFAIDFFNVDLNVLSNQWDTLNPVAPLAWSPALTTAARQHSQLMIEQDLQSHQLPGEPSLGQRLTNAGYTNYSTYGENVFAYSKSVFHGHAGFAIDWTNANSTGIQDPPGHRENIMNPNFREIGIGIVSDNDTSTGVGPLVITQDFGNRLNFGKSWLLGVVFDDTDQDKFYDAGEGLGGVKVSIRGDNGNFSTQTLSAGGYQIQIPNGQYTVRFSGGGLDSVIRKKATVGQQNVKLDALNSASSSGGNTQTGTNRDDQLVGTAKADTLIGKGGDDSLVGKGGDDYLQGDAGNDTLNGGGGQDTCIGGGGRDTLIGGSQRDVFVLALKGNDIVQDFEDGTDRLGLSDGLRFRDVTIEQSGRNVLILSGGDRLATLKGIDASALEGRDFTTV
jgi:Ca2+-binding RTX toxin-like protein